MGGMNTFKFLILASVCCAGSILLDMHSTPAAAAKAADYRLVSKACVPEVAKYCPDLEQKSSSSRGQAICLKPYLSSLSLGCRRAVKAVYQ
jgi:hypothetical protein